MCQQGSSRCRQKFSTALLLSLSLGRQRLARILPGSRLCRVIEKVDLALDSVRLLPARRQRAQLVHLRHVVAAGLDVLDGAHGAAGALGRRRRRDRGRRLAVRVRLLQRGGRAVVPGVADGQPAGRHGGRLGHPGDGGPGDGARAARAPGGHGSWHRVQGGAERRVRRVLPAVRHGRGLGARGRRVEEGDGQLAHGHGLLQGPLRVGLEHYFEQGL